MPIGIALGIGALGSIGSAVIGGSAAESAAQTQANAANNAANLQANEYLINQQTLAPFVDVGSNAEQVLAQLFGITWSPNQTNNGIPTGQLANQSIGQQLSAQGINVPSPNAASNLSAFTSSPGYNYQLQQALNATQNSAAGQTGALSGNMLRALQNNAQGLAGTDYWNYYNALVNNYNTQYTNASNQRNQLINVLGSLGGQGQSAAVQQGGLGQSAVSGINSALQTGASATAAGTIGAANAASSGLNSLSNSASLAYLLGAQNNGYGNGDYGGGGY